MEYFAMILGAGLFLAVFCSVIYNCMSHSRVRDNVLKADAKICDVKTKSVGGRKVTTAALRTTVTFDDGFVYISHKSEKYWLTIYVDPFLLEEIKEDAIKAHKKAYEKQSYNKQ